MGFSTVNFSAVTLSAGQADCQARGGDLVAPASEAINKHLYKMMKETNVLYTELSLGFAEVSVIKSIHFTPCIVIISHLRNG